MLLEAMNAFQILKVSHEETEKAQYTDRGIEKNYFRASELGSGDRKIIYSFFGHQIPKVNKTAKNLRQLENGNYVHDRYQKAWYNMGCLLSMEKRLSSKDDERLSKYDWEWNGHYDGLLDMNILRGYAKGKIEVKTVPTEVGKACEIQPYIDEGYIKEIGYDSPNYEPIRLVADVKTMNPWGFKKVKQFGNLNSYQGYLDQIQFYMYMLDVPYGSIFIENKGTNETLEAQILWSDIHEGTEYKFDDLIHGEKTDDTIRVYVNNQRFDNTVNRISKLWDTVQKLREAGEQGQDGVIAQLIPKRCSDKPNGFPCSWSDGKEKCEFYDHCWDAKHNGLATKSDPGPLLHEIWIFEDDEKNENIKVDIRKLPEEIKDQATFLQWVGDGKLDYMDYAILEVVATTEKDPFKKGDSIDPFIDKEGNLILDFNDQETQKAYESNLYPTDTGKGFRCGNCKRENIVKRIVNNKRSCAHCGADNRFE